ncbi:MAG: DUF3987 domain-containing protein, partial [Planktotalea arctica]
LDAPQVGAQAMAQAIELAEFYLSEASRLARTAVIAKEIDLAEHLRRWLITDWREADIMVRDVLRVGPNALRSDAKTVRAALMVLEAHGWLVQHPTGTTIRGSARKEAWQIVTSHD